MVVGGDSCKNTHTSIPMECKISHRCTAAECLATKTVQIAPTVPALQFYCCLFIHTRRTPSYQELLR
jgi:hypothetical protein